MTLSVSNCTDDGRTWLTDKQLDDLSDYFRGLDKEIPVLEARYRRLLQLFEDYKVADIEEFVTQKMTGKAKASEME